MTRITYDTFCLSKSILKQNAPFRNTQLHQGSRCNNNVYLNIFVASLYFVDDNRVIPFLKQAQNIVKQIFKIFALVHDGRVNKKDITTSGDSTEGVRAVLQLRRVGDEYYQSNFIRRHSKCKLIVIAYA